MQERNDGAQTQKCLPCFLVFFLVAVLRHFKTCCSCFQFVLYQTFIAPHISANPSFCYVYTAPHSGLPVSKRVSHSTQGICFFKSAQRSLRVMQLCVFQFKMYCGTEVYSVGKMTYYVLKPAPHKQSEIVLFNSLLNTINAPK